MRVSGRFAVAATAAVLLASVAGCDALPSGRSAAPDRFSHCPASPNDCNSGQRRSGGDFVVALARPLPSFNVQAGDGATTEAYTVMSSLLPAAFVTAPDGSLSVNPDLLVSAQLTRASPQTVVYTLAPGAVWDDGQPISAADFAYAWRTQNGRDCPGCPAASTGGYDQIASVVGGAPDRTVTVTFSSPYPDWRNLFDALYPAHREGAGRDLSTKDGLAAAFARQATRPDWTGGPYRISAYQPGRSVELRPNPRWYGRDQPTLSTVEYRFIADQASTVAALQARQVNAFSAPPSQDLIDVLHGLAGSGVRYEVTSGPVWQRLDLNTATVTDITLRQAILVAVDVGRIIDQTVRGYFPAVARLYSHNLLTGSPGYQDVVRQVSPEQGSGNLAAARKLLSDGGYTRSGGRLRKSGQAVPPLRLVYSDGPAANLIRDELTALGLRVELSRGGDLAGALDGRDYDLALYGWAGTVSMTASRELWASDGGNNRTGWGDADSDALLRQVAHELDPGRAYDELNRQDAILTRAAVVLPLYQKPQLLAVAGDFVNVRGNPAGVLSYNAQQWGLAR